MNVRTFRRRRSVSRSARRGTSAVEFAIIAPFLFMLLIGMMEFGRAMTVQHALTTAAREGARESILPGSTTDSSKAMVRTYLQATIGLADADIDISADPTAADPGDLITVSVSAPFQGVSLMAGRWFESDFALSGAATMRKEGFE